MTATLLTPLERYREDLKRDDFSPDPAQQQAVEHLQDLYLRLVAAQDSGNGLLAGVRKLFGGRPEPLCGLYFWGGVGRGKTYLMDTFFSCLPFPDKLRLHFHRFMHEVHKELKAMSGQSDPLPKIASQLAARARIICFDEFFVSDITDAMILGGLFENLFSRGVTLVATSNIPPERLYWNGLQRDRFLPAIALLEKHTRVVNVDGGVDYRLRTLNQADIYHWPLDQAAVDNMNFAFEHLAGEPGQEHCKLKVEGRLIDTRRLSESVVWFTFEAICGGPRAQTDYIELSRIYHSVLVSDVSRLTEGDNDKVRRFISLVDEFYERNVKLILSAAVPMEKLYTGTGLAFEFKRTLSRLQEMQSQEYLGREHLP